MRFKRGQLTIFIIIAIMLVAIVAVFFILREQIGIVKIPANMQPIYTSFLYCLEEDTRVGIDILESQGGYIELPDFESGSSYMPFSSQLNFLGNPIPYWYYVSGNNIRKEQVPSKSDMERELESFIEDQIRGCIFDEYYEQGFEITQGEPDAIVSIKDNDVRVNLNMNLNIAKGEDTTLVSNHEIDLKTDLGSLYDSALKIYDYEQKDLFLENYAIDTLRVYAPVDGVDITCSPKIWDASKVFSDLREAIEANTLALRTIGNKNDYFVVDVPISEEVRFINSRDWPSGFEVNPSQGSMLIANPVGNQPGLGILGFCYVPYHFVYNMKYPVLVQIYSENGQEIFQFPLAVVIQGNKPRTALNASAFGITTSGICDYKNTEIEVRTYDVQLNSVDADISYECFGEICDMGRASDGVLKENFPQCVNGFILVKSDGFEDTRYLYSITTSGSVSIILDKVYEIEVDLNLDGKDYNKKTIINFLSDDSSTTLIYPEQKNIKLSEGDYEIQVYIYDESSLNLQKGNYEQCIDVPSKLGGIFGVKKRKCFDVEIPAQIVSNTLSGGGRRDYYILENELKNSNIIEINAQSLPLPRTLEDLQNNYLLFEDKNLGIEFK